MAEETIRYWGLTDTEREAAFQKDSAERMAGGWRVSSRRNEFAFGKPGMDLVVTWVNDGTGSAPSSASGPAQAAAVPPAHFDLNAAIAAATREMPDAPNRLTPAPTAAEPTASVMSSPPVAPVAPVAAVAPTVPAAPTPQPTRERAPEPEPAAEDSESEPEAQQDSPEPADISAPSFTPKEAADTFGANGEDVVWLLDGLAGLDRQTAAEIAQAYGDADEEARERALQSLTGSFSKPPYSRYMKAAEDLIGSWVESVGATGNDAILYDTVASAAIDAVDALIVQDELDSDSFTTLYDPWGSVMDPDDEESESDEPDAEAQEAGSEPATESGPALREAGDNPGAHFGPNTDLAIEFLDALRRVTPAQIDELAKAGTADWEATLGAARHALDRAIAQEPEYRRQCDAIRDEVAAWADRRGGVQFDYSDGETNPVDRQAAQPAVLDAAQALVIADLLEPDDAKDLYASWQYAVGLPALPEYEGDADESADAGDATGASELGPNADDLARFFDALANLSADQLAKLAGPANGSNAAALDESWGRAVEAAADKAEYRAQLELVVREVMAWRDGVAGRYCGYQGAQGTEADRERARNRILRSAVGLLYADLLEREDAERLYGPWSSVVGEPPLPEYKDD